jgi:uncharacterized RDD family membrane protein YckC
MTSDHDDRGAEEHLRHGWELLDRDRHLEAEEEFREAVRLAPSSAEAHRALRRLLADAGRHDEADAEFHAVIELRSGGTANAEEGWWERQRGRWNRPSARSAVKWRPARGPWPPAEPDGMVYLRRGLASPAVLLRSPRARPLRRILAGYTDVLAIPVLALLVTAKYGRWAMIAAVVVSYALNGCLEGWTGQSLGKMAGGLHTIRRGTGERIGGGRGTLRRLLHVLDTPLVGYVVGLASGRTFADRIMGTEVVWNPRWVITTSAGEIAVLEREDYEILRRRLRRLLVIYVILNLIVLESAAPERAGYGNTFWIIRRLRRWSSYEEYEEYEEEDAGYEGDAGYEEEYYEDEDY